MSTRCDEHDHDAQYDLVARQYRAFRRHGGTANDLVEIPCATELIGDVKGLNVLDAGCGFGFYSLLCAERGAKVTACDIAEPQIALAREHCASHASSLTYLVADLSQPGVVTDALRGAFDLVLANISVHFGLERFFANCGLLLRRGGRLIYSQVHPVYSALRAPEPDAPLVLEDYYRSGHRTRCTRNIFGTSELGRDYDWHWNHYTIEEVSERLASAGFLIRRIREPRPALHEKGAGQPLLDVWNRVPVFVVVEAILSPDLGIRA